MYYFYIILFLIANIWILNRISKTFRQVLLNSKIDKSYPILFNVLTKEYKKKRAKKTGLTNIKEIIKKNF